MPFSTTRTLRFGNCDPAGIAYFPSYLDILVGVIEEFFETLGTPWPDLNGRQRIGTPTVKLDLVFAKPGFHGDRLDWTLQVRGVGRSSLDLEHAIASKGAPLWSARQRLVAVSLDTQRPLPWPEPLRAALLRHLEPEEADGAAREKPLALA